MTKAELLEHVERLESNSLEGKVENFLNESKLLGEDLMKMIAYVFNLGASTRRHLDPLLKQAKVKASVFS